MIDEKLEEGRGEEPKRKKGKGKLLIIIIAAAVIAGGAGAGAFFFFAKPVAEQAREEAVQDDWVMFALDPFIVNLKDPVAARFLKVSMHLELRSPKIAEKAEAKTPQLRDAIITILRGKTSEELILMEGQFRLRDAIAIRTNQILGENSVRNVFFTEFVMQ
ncbi:flagellar basal body-associated FliL family protein [Thermodesulfovibrionales bacterium]|nr:flagellar basal body-associated FliL family protein [Thermodesulfovibrionales bacterium]